MLSFHVKFVQTDRRTTVKKYGGEKKKNGKEAFVKSNYFEMKHANFVYGFFGRQHFRVFLPCFLLSQRQFPSSEPKLICHMPKFKFLCPCIKRSGAYCFTVVRLPVHPSV